jgi:hypothetical protein
MPSGLIGNVTITLKDTVIQYIEDGPQQLFVAVVEYQEKDTMNTICMVINGIDELLTGIKIKEIFKNNGIPDAQVIALMKFEQLLRDFDNQTQLGPGELELPISS